jgi:hypothetical protein
LTDRDDLWRLLVVLTVRKAINLFNSQMRKADKLVGEAELLGGDDAGASPLDRLIGDEPTPRVRRNGGRSVPASSGRSG